MMFSEEYYVDLGLIPIQSSIVYETVGIPLAALEALMRENDIHMDDFAIVVNENARLSEISSYYLNLPDAVEREAKRLYKEVVRQFKDETGLDLRLNPVDSDNNLFGVDTFLSFQPTPAMNKLIREQNLESDFIIFE